MKTITTTKGEMRIPELWLAGSESCIIDGKTVLVEMKTGIVNTAIENTAWVEYWLGGEVIHRSAHVILKPQAAAQSDVGRF